MTVLPLRVGVNLCWLVPGVVGGSEYLLVDWLRAVAEHQADRHQAMPVALTVLGSGDLRDAHPFLADALAGRPVDHLYAADTRRAQQTAASVANEFKLPVNLLAGSDWAGLASRIRRDHRGETVVVVGYGSTLPAVLDQLSAQHVVFDAGDYGSIYVVVVPSPGQPRVLRLRYGNPPPAT